jgi:hypothetical protein
LCDRVVSLDIVWMILCGLVFDEFGSRSGSLKTVILRVWVSSGRLSGRYDDSNVAQC